MAMSFLPCHVSDQLLVWLLDVLFSASLCNASVDISSSGGSAVLDLLFQQQNKSGGLPPVAISKGEYPLIVNCVFLAK